MKPLTLLLASVFCAGLIAAEADYQTQHDSADKAFNELEGKQTDASELELQKKELEIERLKLELEKRKLAEEKQKLKSDQLRTEPQSKTLPQEEPRGKQSGFYIGIEAFGATGRRTSTVKNSSGVTLSETESDIDYTHQKLQLGLIVEGNRVALGVTAGKEIRDSDGSLYKKGTGVDMTFDLVSDSLYDPASTSNILPFLRLGAGIGVYEHLDEDKIYFEDDTATAIEGKLGLGLYYQINETFEIAASYEWMFSVQNYQDTSDNTLEISDTISGIALGFNAHF